MQRLSKKEYWDSIYTLEASEREQRSPRKSPLKILIKTLLGEKIVEYIHKYMIRSYADYLLWDVIYKKYMPNTKGAKALEVGSAPGDDLVRLNQTFGFVPYGVEYSHSGVELNRKTFILYNINPDNVIHADFFSDEFHKQYKGYFDIVISRGFVEHFTDVEDVIEKHINLLTKGGHLIVSIPNFRGINYFLAWLFHKEFLATHNINIMQKREFSKIFSKRHLLTLFCNYYGTFNFWLFSECFAKETSPMRFILKCCNNLQFILNMIFHLLFKNKGAESKLFSPYLIFIGVKEK